MKYVTIEDDASCNESVHETIYVDGDGDNQTQDESNATDEPNSSNLSAEGDIDNFLDKTRASKQLRKACRNSGKAYITSSGKYIPEKKVTPLTECRAKCNTRFTLEMQHAIFNEYWSLGSYDRRAAYVSSMITVSDKKSIRPRNYDSDKEKFRMKTYSYALEFNGERRMCCKGCFLKTLDESEGLVKTVATKIKTFPIINVHPYLHGNLDMDLSIIPAKSTLPIFC